MKGIGGAAPVLLALAMLVTTAVAQPGMPGGMGPCPGMAPGPERVSGEAGGDGLLGDPGMLMRFLDRLDLTDGQWEAVEAIMESSRDSIEEIREEARDGEPMREFLSMFAEDELSLEDLEVFVSDLDSVRARIREISLQALVDIHEILTPGQLETVSDLAERASTGREMSRPMR